MKAGGALAADERVMMSWPKLAIHLVTNIGIYPRSHSRLEPAWDPLREP